MLKLSLLILITLTDVLAQTGEPPLSPGAKARYCLSSTVEPAALVEMAAYAGVLQALPTPQEWRQGAASAYGAAFLSNQWYPDRLNTVGQGFLQGTATLGLDAPGNIITEFWPKPRRKLQKTGGKPPAAAAYATVQ